MENKITQKFELSAEFIERIKKCKEILAEVETSSLAETADEIKSEQYPERELGIFENIARVYQSFISENSITDLAVKEDVFMVLIEASNGLNELEDFKNIRFLTREQVEKLIYKYHPVFLDDVI